MFSVSIENTWFLHWLYCPKLALALVVAFLTVARYRSFVVFSEDGNYRGTFF